MAFRTSSKCGDRACGCGCVEVDIREEAEMVVLRDTEGRTVEYTFAEWADFLDGATKGEFDLPAREPAKVG